MGSLRAEMANLIADGSASDLRQRLKDILKGVVSTSAKAELGAQLKDYADGCLGEDVSLDLSQHLIADLIERLAETDADIAIQVACHLQERLVTPGLSSYITQSANLAILLSRLYESGENFAAAAEALKDFLLDNKSLSHKVRMEMLSRKAQLELKSGKSMAALRIVHRLTLLEDVSRAPADLPSEAETAEDRLKLHLQAIISASGAALRSQLLCFVDMVLMPGVALATQKLLLYQLHCNIMKREPAVTSPVCKHVVTKLKQLPDSSIFAEDANAFKGTWATSLEVGGENRKAAELLRYLAGQPRISLRDRLDFACRSAQLFLKGSYPINAESILKQVASQIEEANDLGLSVKFKGLLAHSFDHLGKFVEAGEVFLEVAQTERVSKQDQTNALRNAAKCAVLASEAPKKGHLVAALCCDERTQSLNSHSLLLSIHRREILNWGKELEHFEAELQKHQKEMTPNGLSILKEALMSHNILSASKQLKGITFQKLGRLLDVEKECAVKVSSAMLAAGGIKASSDESGLRFD